MNDSADGPGNYFLIIRVLQQRRCKFEIIVAGRVGRVQGLPGPCRAENSTVTYFRFSNCKGLALKPLETQLILTTFVVGYSFKGKQF